MQTVFLYPPYIFAQPVPVRAYSDMVMAVPLDIQTVQSVCQQQMDLLEKLPELPPVPVAEEAAEAPVEEPQKQEEVVPAALTEEALEQDIQNVFAAFAQAEEKAAEPVFDATDDPFANDEELDLASTRKLNLDELQFGRNYMKD